MSHIQNHVDGTTFTANLGIGCRFAEEPTKQSEGSQTGSISTSSGLHRVEQQNSGQVGLENSPSLRCFKDAIDSSSGGSSARVRLDPANLEDVASKPVAQTPFVQALNTLLSLVDTERFPRNPTELRDSTDGCSEGEVKTINEALHAASTHYDETYGLRDQDGSFQRNDQNEICFESDAPSRSPLFRQALEQLLKEPKASDAKSVLVPQSPRTANALAKVAVSLTEEAEDNSQRTIKVSSGPTFFGDAFQKYAKVIKEVDDFNSAIEELSDQLKSQDFDVEKFLAGKDLSESKKQEITNFVTENKSDPSLSIKVLRLKKIVNPKQDSIKHWIGSTFAKPTTSIKKLSCPSMPTKQDIKDAFFSKKFNLAKAIFKLDQVEITNNWFSNLLNKHGNDHSHSEFVRTSIAVVTLFAGSFFAIFRSFKWTAVHVIGVLANVITLALPPIVLLATGAAIIGLCIFNPFAGVAAILGICVLVLIANQYKLSNQMKDLKEEIAKLQNLRRDSAASSETQSRSNTPRSANGVGAFLDEAGAALAADVLHPQHGADDGAEGFE